MNARDEALARVRLAAERRDPDALRKAVDAQIETIIELEVMSSDLEKDLWLSAYLVGTFRGNDASNRSGIASIRRMLGVDFIGPMLTGIERAP